MTSQAYTITKTADNWLAELNGSYSATDLRRIARILDLEGVAARQEVEHQPQNAI